MPITAPTELEQSLWQRGCQVVAGIDEVGRGAWAGPLVVGIVIFPPHFVTNLPINDSKKLSPNLRESLASEIKQLALAYALIEVEVEQINQQGVGAAAQWGFLRAATTVIPTPQHLLIDAFPIAGYPSVHQTPIIRGDSLSISIAAASIIAKVHRDHLMRNLHLVAPSYGFDTHVGYGTAQHRTAIKKHGLSVYHRTSYNLAKWL